MRLNIIEHTSCETFYFNRHLSYDVMAIFDIGENKTRICDARKVEVNIHSKTYMRRYLLHYQDKKLLICYYFWNRLTRSLNPFLYSMLPYCHIYWPDWKYNSKIVTIDSSFGDRKNFFTKFRPFKTLGSLFLNSFV